MFSDATRTPIPPEAPPGTAGPLDANRQPAAAAADARAGAFGRIVALLLGSPRHQMLPLGVLNAHVVPPVALGQFAIASAQLPAMARPAEAGAAPAMAAPPADGALVDVAAAILWATVSPAVDQRLTESTDDILRVAANEWNCGEQPWIIEAIGDPRLISELIKRLVSQRFTEHPPKLRAVLPDGRIAVGRVEHRVEHDGAP
ncbi:MAG: toxin-activating lysine-acyltransferase [Hyphomicrobium sp.]